MHDIEKNTATSGEPSGALETNRDNPISFASASPHGGLIYRHSDNGDNPIISYSWKRLAFANRPSSKVNRNKKTKGAGEEK
jgi:hypothetical protein